MTRNETNVRKKEVRKGGERERADPLADLFPLQISDDIRGHRMLILDKEREWIEKEWDELQGAQSSHHQIQKR